MAYIEREALLKVLRGSAVAKYPTSFAMGLFTAANEVSKLPAADVAPVVHGWWTYNGYDAVCSHCGFEWFASCQECGVCPDDVNYCPNCGAKMKDGDG